jgi:hypothetical protein
VLLACLVPETLIKCDEGLPCPGLVWRASAHADGAAKESVDALAFSRADRLAYAGRRANRWPLAAHLRLYLLLIVRPSADPRSGSFPTSIVR